MGITQDCRVPLRPELGDKKGRLLTLSGEVTPSKIRALSGRRQSWTPGPRTLEPPSEPGDGRGVSRSGCGSYVGEFFGIAIYMYWGDHGPPHFHARYGGEEASIAIEDLSVVAGGLSRSDATRL